MYRSTSKDKQIRVNKGFIEELDNTVDRSQQKERHNTDTNEDNITSSKRTEIHKIKKYLKYIKIILKASRQWLANKEEANLNSKNIKIKNQKIAAILNLTNARKQK